MQKMKIALAVLLMIICGCKEGGMVQKRSLYAQIDSIPQERWDSLARKKIYFGHQSVGQNIIDGLNELMRSHPAVKLDIRETARPVDLEKPVFAHSRIGENMNPRSKIDHFREIMESGVGQRADIAFFKLCYVDITRDTDVEALFRHYDETMKYLGDRFPNLRIVTVTAPLTMSPSGIKARIGHMLGRASGSEEDNVKRNILNAMLRERFGSSVFDLAAYESTSSDGERVAFTRNGETFYMLNQAYSLDGGHLNEMGRQAVAADLLRFLTDLDR